MKLAVYGAGGVGAYFGARLAAAGADVHLIARGDHLDALQADGVRVDSIRGDLQLELPATYDPADVGPCDYVLFCVKSFDTELAARNLDPMIREETAVISLQNGVDNEGKIADEIGREHVMGGVTYIFSTIAEPGTIEHTGGPARLVFGELDGSRSDRAERFADWTSCAEGMEGTLAEDITSELWKKYTYICAQAGATAAIRLPIGELRAVEESWSLYRNLLEEVHAVAISDGIDLPVLVVQEWIEYAREVKEGAYSSLHYDMTNGKRMELEALHGTVVRKADELGVEVPYTRAVYAILRPWAVRNDTA